MKSLKNLFHIFRRFKMASVLNILGLSIAFASFSIIMMQVSYEQNYNKCHEKIDRIARLEWNINGEGFAAVVQRPLAEAVKKSVHVEQVALFNPVVMPQTITVIDGDEERHFMNSMTGTTAELPKIFSFKFTQGDENSLDIPGSVIIPKSLADIFFLNVPALGQTIVFEDTTRTVSGVYKDLPKNSTIGNHIYYAMEIDTPFNNWNSANDFAYVLFDSRDNMNSEVIKEVASHIEPYNFDCNSVEEFVATVDSRLRFNPLEDLYYSNEVKYIFSEVGSRQTTFLLICVALIIIIIAGINFTNFSTALTPMRIKGINTRKVLGSSVSSLRASLILEGIYVSFVSFLFSLAIIYICKGTFIESYISSGIDFEANISILVLTAIISIVAGVLAGLYPAFYMTSFSPALVLKGSFGLSIKGKKIRTVLLSIQYIASIALLIVASFMIIQNKYMLNTAFGYDKDQIVTVMVNDNIHKSENAFINSLTQHEGIDYAAFSYVYLGCMDDGPNWGRDFNETHIQFNAYAVTPDFLKTLGVEVVEGRNFRESDTQVPGGTFIFNQMAKEQFGLKLGDRIDGEVIGFMPNIVYTSFRRPIQPMCFTVFGSEGNWLDFPLNVCYIRINKGTPYDVALNHIKSTLKEYDPDTPFEVTNLDDEIENAYQHEKSVSSLISIFSIISIIISVVGIYGLVVFETEYKRKEIGVRKVFGSTISGIMGMFTISYLKLIIICSIIAVPISYYFVDRWLDKFQMRTPMYWWVFVGALVIICFITIATTSIQNYKAACTNPVNSLKGE